MSSIKDPIIPISNALSQQCQHCILSLSTNSIVYLQFKLVHEYCLIANQFTPIDNTTAEHYKLDTDSLLSLKFKSFQLYFFDFILVIETSKDYAILDYSDLSINIEEIHVYEKELKQNIDYGNHVNETWLHPRLNGEPDLRFSYNPKIYDVIYSHLSIDIYRSFHISLLFSDIQTAHDLYTFIKSKLNAAIRPTTN